MFWSDLWLIMLLAVTIALGVLVVSYHRRDAKRCRHCGRLPEKDGDHICTCPYSDEHCHHTRNS